MACQQACTGKSSAVLCSKTKGGSFVRGQIVAMLVIALVLSAVTPVVGRKNPKPKSNAADQNAGPGAESMSKAQLRSAALSVLRDIELEQMDNRIQYEDPEEISTAAAVSSLVSQVKSEFVKSPPPPPFHPPPYLPPSPPISPPRPLAPPQPRPPPPVLPGEDIAAQAVYDAFKSSALMIALVVLGTFVYRFFCPTPTLNKWHREATA